MAERKLIVQIVGDSKQLERTFAKTSKSASNFGKNLERAGRGGIVATVGFRGLGRSVAFASGAFLGGAGFIALTRKALDAASDLSEEINKSNVLFGRNAAEVRRWSKTTATSIGISQRGALQASGAFGAMFATLRLGDDVSASMSKRLVKLGADLASFSNEDPSDMLDRLRSGLAGEAEPLRRFGILLSEARVKQEAYRSGIAKAGATLTEQQKVLARFNLILKDSGKAQGDFARTSTSQANQERINAALREEAAQRIGQVLLPAFNQATRAVNKWLGSERNLAKLQNATAQALGIATKAAKAFREVFNTMAPIVERINKALGGTENTVKLLLAALIAGKILSFTSAITGLGTQSLASAGKVNALRAALLRLGALAVITIGIELLLNRKSIDDAVNDFLRGNKLGFLTGKKITLPIDATVGDLEAIRAKVRELHGDNDLMVKALDKAIAKFRAFDKVKLTKAEESVKKLTKRFAGIQDKKVDVTVAQKGLDGILKQLVGIKDKTVEVKVLEQGLTALQTRLGQVKGKTVEVAFIESGLTAIQAELDRLSGRTIEVAVTTTEMQGRGGGAPAGLARSAVETFESVPKIIDNEIDRINKLAKSSRVKARRAFENLMDSLSRDLTAASATTNEEDNLRVLQRQLSAVQAEIRIEGKTKELLDQQADITAQIVVTQREIREDSRDAAAEARATAAEKKAAALARVKAAREVARANRQANQFERLGLTREGSQRVPGVGALKKRLGTLREQVKGSVLDTAKTQSQLAAIAKVLSGKFGKVGRDVRSAILQMFADISGALDQGDKGKQGPLTKFAKRGVEDLVKGLGLTAEQIKEIRQRSSQIGAGGTAPRAGIGAFGAPVVMGVGAGAGGAFIIHNHIHLDGKEIAVSTTNEQQKKKGRGARSRRGRQ